MKKIFFFVILIFFVKNIIAQNVGIGNVAPLMNLHVTSTDSAVALFENTQALNVNVSNAMYFKTGSSGFPYTGAIKTTGESTSAARMGLFTYSSVTPNQLLERVSITDIGNVGLGTINPLTKLHVVKADSAVALFENTQQLNTNISNAIYFKTGLSGLSYTGAIKTIGENTNAARIGFFTFAAVNANSLKERMSIADGGNVGIGVTAPLADLHINPAGAGSLLIGTNQNAGGYTNIQMGISAQSNGYGYLQTIKASGVSYGDLIINQSGGAVGIGTSLLATGYKLNVNGKIISEEVRVLLKANWPDYVFAKNYNLLSLNNLESFISKNKHLPNVPSADEVKKDGITLGEMNGKLLEKIEELTLYIIELDKKANEQKLQTETLKKEIDILKAKY
jgi:hypothetical protein